MVSMIIQNFEELANTEKKKECLEILEAGLQAANPEEHTYQIMLHQMKLKLDGKIIQY